MDDYAGDLAARLYKLGFSKVLTTSAMPQTAEAVKITENIFRAVNIALVNELKLIYSAMGIDIWEVIEAAKTKPFGFMPFYPGPASAATAFRSTLFISPGRRGNMIFRRASSSSPARSTARCRAFVVADSGRGAGAPLRAL